MHIVELSPSAFDRFASIHPYGSFYQSSAYAKLMVKEGYSCFYLGLANDNNVLEAASLFLFKKEPYLLTNVKYAYAPRGFLLDYNNIALVEAFSIEVKKFLGTKGFTFIKIDPLVIYNERDKNGQIIPTSKTNSAAIRALNHLGYIHKGYNLDFETQRPRSVMITYNDDDILETFSTVTKNKIKTAIKRGLSIDIAPRSELLNFYNLVKSQLPDRKIEYYLNLYDIFSKQNMIELFKVELDPNFCLKNMRSDYEEELDINNQLVEDAIKADPLRRKNIITKKMASDELLASKKKLLDDAIKMAKKFHSKITVGYALVIKHNKELTFYMMGYDKRFNMSINTFARFAIMNRYKPNEIERFNLNGISLNFNKDSKYYGLFEDKRGLNAMIYEYIGEFDLVINQTNYQIYLNYQNNVGLNTFNYFIKKIKDVK